MNTFFITVIGSVIGSVIALNIYFETVSYNNKESIRKQTVQSCVYNPEGYNINRVPCSEILSSDWAKRIIKKYNL